LKPASSSSAGSQKNPYAAVVRVQLEESCQVKQSFSAELVERIAQLAQRAAATLAAGGKIVLFGNGGSAADAQHLAAEFVVRLHTNRPALAALAITVNTSVLTAAANDYGFENIFARQIEALVAGGDLLIALSTSGSSANILRGAAAGRARGAYLVAFSGETGGALSGKVDLLLNIPSRDPQRIQEAHIFIGHTLCAMVESRLGLG